MDFSPLRPLSTTYSDAACLCPCPCYLKKSLIYQPLGPRFPLFNYLMLRALSSEIWNLRQRYYREQVSIHQSRCSVNSFYSHIYCTNEGNTTNVRYELIYFYEILFTVVKMYRYINLQNLCDELYSRIYLFCLLFTAEWILQ